MYGLTVISLVGTGEIDFEYVCEKRGAKDWQTCGNNLNLTLYLVGFSMLAGVFPGVWMLLTAGQLLMFYKRKLQHVRRELAKLRGDEVEKPYPVQKFEGGDEKLLTDAEVQDRSTSQSGEGSFGGNVPDFKDKKGMTLIFFFSAV